MHYSLVEPIIEFIRHNENITFKVTDKKANRSYLLRIHKPISEGLSGVQHTWNGLQAEMRLLQEIAHNNILKVQKPVANREGEWVTDYNSEQFGATFATLLEWIEGSTLTLEEDNITQIVYKLGEDVARLHKFSQTLVSQESHRPLYDAARIEEELTELPIYRRTNIHGYFH
ncbi:phosphotransferase [Paenibacillus sp. NPDC058177]|uniref:phosphotransferase n=1 Tax=Paenibacillus sp. NPDC058177 TaxID=3346369 RepID=UPI0036D8BCF7